MKKTICILLLGLIVMTPISASQLNKLTVDIQGGFTGQRVTVIVNGIYMWSSVNATSDKSTDFVDSFEFRYISGTDLVVKVIVDEDEFVKKLNLENEIFLRIQRNNNNNIVFEVSKIPYLYD